MPSAFVILNFFRAEILNKSETTRYSAVKAAADQGNTKIGIEKYNRTGQCTGSSTKGGMGHAWTSGVNIK
jgi:hypothetical protein